jgi:Icc-related predicted phosphoesterase
MKVGVCSDLHLEFKDINITNDEGVDVLILSGDILVERDIDIYDRRQEEMGFARGRSMRLHDFFSRVCFQFPQVLYVVGNHEHYHGDFKYTVSELKKKLAKYENLTVLEKEVKVIGDVTFIGGTLWTDMNREDPITLHAIKDMMNDFRCVDNSDRKVTFKTFDADGNVAFKIRDARFSPQDAVEDHRKMLDFIKTIVAEKHDEKFVVVGHHTPSHKSCHPKYAHDEVMNGGYHSDLSEFILDRPQIKLWTHGHTHELFDYMIGETRVVCNPRGYAGYEDIADTFKLKVVEV